MAQERQNATLLLNMMDSDMIPSQLKFDRSEVTFDLAPSVVLVWWRSDSISNVSILITRVVDLVSLVLAVVAVVV